MGGVSTIRHGPKILPAKYFALDTVEGHDIFVAVQDNEITAKMIEESERFNFETPSTQKKTISLLSAATKALTGGVARKSGYSISTVPPKGILTASPSAHVQRLFEQYNKPAAVPEKIVASKNFEIKFHFSEPAFASVQAYLHQDPVLPKLFPQLPSSMKDFLAPAKKESLDAESAARKKLAWFANLLQTLEMARTVMFSSLAEISDEQQKRRAKAILQNVSQILLSSMDGILTPALAVAKEASDARATVRAQIINNTGPLAISSPLEDGDMFAEGPFTTKSLEEAKAALMTQQPRKMTKPAAQSQPKKQTGSGQQQSFRNSQSSKDKDSTKKSESKKKGDKWKSKYKGSSKGNAGKGKSSSNNDKDKSSSGSKEPAKDSSKDTANTTA